MGKFFKSKDPTKLRTERVVPIAREVIKLIAEANLPLGESPDTKPYDVLSKKVLQLLLDKKFKFIDKEFLFQIVLQPFSFVQETVLLSLKTSLNNAHDVAMGVKFDEATLEDLDKILRLKPDQISTKGH